MFRIIGCLRRAEAPEALPFARCLFNLSQSESCKDTKSKPLSLSKISLLLISGLGIGLGYSSLKDDTSAYGLFYHVYAYGRKERTDVPRMPPGPWLAEDELLAEIEIRKATTRERQRWALHTSFFLDGMIGKSIVLNKFSEEKLAGLFEAAGKDYIQFAIELRYRDKENFDAYKRFLRAYGCVKWSEAALQEVSEYAPIVELCAARGQWQHALAARGVQAVAFEEIEVKNAVGKVQLGSEEVLEQYPDHALLLICPDRNEQAYHILTAYQGDTVLYVGEARGGNHANDSFFRELFYKWDFVKSVEVEPFPGPPHTYEKLWVLRRKGAPPLQPKTKQRRTWSSWASSFVSAK